MFTPLFVDKVDARFSFFHFVVVVFAVVVVVVFTRIIVPIIRIESDMSDTIGALAPLGLAAASIKTTDMHGTNGG